MNIRYWTLCLLVGIGMICSHAHAAPDEAEHDWSEQFQRQVAAWIENLSAKDEQFTEWNGAKTEVEALGVNSHQWLVRLRKDGTYVGYLVVGEVPTEAVTRPRSSTQGVPKAKPSFVLLEYGLGEFILFHDAFAPLQLSAEPVYDGFASHWQVALDDQHRQYIDAKTGEKYPATVQSLDRPIMSTLSVREVVGSNGQLTRQRIVSRVETDPFDRIDWLKAVPLSPLDEEVTRKLWQENYERIVISCSLFGDQVMAPFVVGSIHLWNDSLTYIGVWDEGLRYVPLPYVNKVGKVIIP
ncbi:MAG: hypothetical protein H0Z34_05530 [Brevibacillus sp.]|nr:hypothetical protein [Brevibacillus sp.]